MKKFWDTLGIEGTGISRFQTIFFYWRICIKYLYKALCESVTCVVLKLIDRNMHLKNLKCFLLYVKYFTVCYVKILLNLSCFVLLQWVVLMSSVSQTILKFLLLVSFRSTSIFVFGYAMFYYYKRSNMSGMLQSVQFFGYTLLTCYVFFLMLSTVAFFASLKFIRYIYVNLKMD